MRPAPNDEAGLSVCDLECGQSQCGRKERGDDLMHPSQMTTERLSASWWSLVETPQLAAGSAYAENCEFCPKCGRTLGFDGDGNPTVGYSPAQLERAGKQLAFRLFCIAQSGYQHKACTNQTRDDIWQQELTATGAGV